MTGYREVVPLPLHSGTWAKIQLTKMLVTCHRFGDLFLFGLVWQYFQFRQNVIKVGSKSWLPTYSSNIPYKSPILGKLLNLISLAKIILFESRFKSYDPRVIANCLP